MTIKTITVTSSAELSAALKSATGGETIVLSGQAKFSLSLADHNPASTVTITSADPQAPATFETVSLTRCSNITIDSVDFNSAGTTRASWLNDLNITDCSKIALINSVMTNTATAFNDGTATVGDNAISIYDSDGITIAGNTIQNYYNSLHAHRSSDIIIEGNELTKIQGDGMQFSAITNMLIKDNYLHDFLGSLHSLNHDDMIQFWTSGTTAPTSNITITGNILDSQSGSATQGIFFGNEVVRADPTNTAMYYQNVVIDNNFVRNGEGNGIAVYYTNGLQITNNAVLFDATAYERGYNTNNIAIQVAGNATNAVASGNVSDAYVLPSYVTQSNNTKATRGTDGSSIVLDSYYPDPTAPVVDTTGGTTTTTTTSPTPAPDPTSEPTPTEITGTAEIDTLSGSEIDDTIRGLAGADRLLGKGGTDTIYGDDGDDAIYGDEGDDKLYGGLGNDLIYGGLGTDSIWGDDGNDMIYADEGNDNVYGGEGSDTLSGGAGDDLIEGGNGDDALRGGDGIDTINGGANNDFIDGGVGDDLLDGGDGSDQVIGGDGIDTIYGAAGNDLIRGDAGDDKLAGGDGDDTVYGDAGNDTISGGIGVDVLYGGDDNDTLNGDAGDDLMYGDAGDDLMYGGDGNDLLRGGTGNDRLLAGIGADVLRGEAGNDYLYGEAGNDQLEGGDGDDWLYGGLGKDALSGGAGTDMFVFDAALDGNRDTISDFSASVDKIVLNTSVFAALAGKTLTSGMFRSGSMAKDSNDYLLYNNGVLYYDADGSGKGAAVAIATISNKAALSYQSFVLTTASGALSAAAASTTLAGSEAPSTATKTGTHEADKLLGTSSTEILKGLEGDDTIKGGGGDDWLHGGLGKDSLTGGSGNDVFVFDTAFDGKRDTIVDFARGDKIGLDTDIFGVFEGNAITAANFRSGSMAKDADDFLLYVNGVLYYDADGSGEGAAVQIASLSNNATLSHSSFLLL